MYPTNNPTNDAKIPLTERLRNIKPCKRTLIFTMAILLVFGISTLAACRASANSTNRLLIGIWFDDDSGLMGSALTFREDYTVFIEGVHLSRTGRWTLEQNQLTITGIPSHWTHYGTWTVYSISRERLVLRQRIFTGRYEFRHLRRVTSS